MSDLGLFASKFNHNTNFLRQFDSALRYFKNPNVDLKSTKTQIEIKKILSVLKPIVEKINGNLSNSISLNEQSVVDVLNQIHANDWQRYKDLLNNIAKNLEIGKLSFSQQEFSALEDIAVALDTECANLFRRINGRV